MPPPQLVLGQSTLTGGAVWSPLLLQGCSWALALAVGCEGVSGTPVSPSLLCPQAQRKPGGAGGAEARFSELVERYKRKILGSDAPTPKRSKWFES